MKGKSSRWQLGLQFLPYAMKLAEARRTDAVYVRRQELIPIHRGMIDNQGVHDLDWVSFELEKRVNEWRLKGRPVVLSVPLSNIVIRRLTIPRVPEKEIRALVDIEIENTLHLPFVSPVFDYVKLEGSLLDEPSEPDALDLLVIAAPHDTVQSYVETVRKSGLKPIAVDVEPLAIYRAMEEEFAQLPGNGSLLINVTLTGVEVAIFSNAIPEFVRSVPLPVPFFNEADIPETLEQAVQAIRLLETENRLSGYVDDLYAEVTRIMNFFQYSMHEGRQRVESIFLTGEFGDLPKLANELAKRFAVPVWSPRFEQVNLPGQAGGMNGFAAAVGLALKDVSRR